MSEIPSGSASADAHHADAAKIASIPVAIITVSDTRTPETDDNGRFLRECLAARGDILALYRIVPDEPALVEAGLDDALAAGARVVLVNGGTGIAPRDTTIDTLLRRLDKVLPGFGELFRMLSWEQVGAAAMLSRAAAGTIGNAAVFVMPGSSAAVRLAWEKLLAPELAHVVRELDRPAKAKSDHA